MDSASSRMPKFDLEKDKSKLNSAQLEYMRIALAQQQEKAKKLARVRSSNRITAALLGIGVVSIFGYSVWSVGSEKFLENFDEPEDRKKEREALNRY